MANFLQRPGGETLSPARLGRDDAQLILNSLRRRAKGKPAKKAKRPVHGTGLFAEGTFTPSNELAPFTVTPHLTVERSDVIARFSNFARDDWARKTDVRGLACRLTTPNGEELDLVAMTAPRFPVRRIEDFHKLPTTVFGWIPFALSRRTTFMAILTALRFQKRRKVRDLAAERYFGIHTFWLVNGAAHAVRYHWEPVDPKPPSNSSAYLDGVLLDHLIEPDGVRFALVVDMLDHDAPSRVINDPMRRWPSHLRELGPFKNRKRWRGTTRHVAGELRLTEILPNDEPDGPLARMVFNPVPVTEGFLPSDDEILHARGSAYVASHVERNGE